MRWGAAGSTWEVRVRLDTGPSVIILHAPPAAELWRGGTLVCIKINKFTIFARRGFNLDIDRENWACSDIFKVRKPLDVCLKTAKPGATCRDDLCNGDEKYSCGLWGNWEKSKLHDFAGPLQVKAQTAVNLPRFHKRSQERGRNERNNGR
jgi:hypothetical protein